MKIQGREIKGKNRVTKVFPREGEAPIVIVAEAVSDLSRIDEYLVYPEPPVALGKGGEKIKNHDDPGYKQQVIHYNVRRMAWLVLESLKPTGIEWDTVKIDDPSTWTNYNQELQDAGFSAVEISMIGNAVMEANALDEDKLEAARQVFLRGQAAAAKSTSGRSTEQPSSQSGEPASESEPDHQE